MAPEVVRNDKQTKNSVHVINQSAQTVGGILCVLPYENDYA